MENLESILFIVIFALLMLLIYAGFVLYKKKVKKAEKQMDKYDFAVRKPKSLLLLWIVSALMGGTLTIFFIIFPEEADELGYLLFCAFWAASTTVLAVDGIFWRVKVVGSTIHYRNGIGLTKKLSFNDISAVLWKNPYSESHQKITLFSGKTKLFSIKSDCVGYQVVLERLKQEQTDIKWTVC